MKEKQASALDNYRGVWGNRIGFGERAALVIIDFAKAYTEPESPLFADGVPPAVEETVRLLESARRNGILVIHTAVVHHRANFIDGGTWLKKSPVVKCMIQKNYSDFCDGVEPRPDELVVTKQYASAFFGTTLAPTLMSAGIDTVILTGCSTSGCIRASAVDGVQHGFRVIVPRECVGDRHPGPHEANLFDIDSKYGDVVAKDEVLAYFDRAQHGNPD
ncbi:N-carbamoylsarcosine amidohydrolase [Pandoraea cepalis]|uniref:N-carbamoylsarcosine amidase n=1 Tax=Pandoraea cepalis TaxID=2508294 RepID=A0A5E4VLY7_9BURK|nr:N-carbamoylsarcosine amidohydrolase [Pandoraea cepalis]VVE13397.1 N-carbamoylsarcosine amidase [Pandoraea cepalis]